MKLEIDKPPLGSARLVPKGYMWSLWKVLLTAFVLGILGCAAIEAIKWPIRSPWPLRFALLITCLAILILGCRIKTWHHICLFAAVYWIACLGCVLAVSVFRGEHIVTTDLLIVVLGQTLKSLLINLVIWVAVRYVVAGPSVKPSLTCPVCSYSLIGNVSGECPECGTSIPFEHMGITQEQFFELAAKLNPPNNVS